MSREHFVPIRASMPIKTLQMESCVLSTYSCLSYLWPGFAVGVVVHHVAAAVGGGGVRRARGHRHGDDEVDDRQSLHCHLLFHPRHERWHAALIRRLSGKAALHMHSMYPPRRSQVALSQRCNVNFVAIFLSFSGTVCFPFFPHPGFKPFSVGTRQHRARVQERRRHTLLNERMSESHSCRCSISCCRSAAPIPPIRLPEPAAHLPGGRLASSSSSSSSPAAPTTTASGTSAASLAIHPSIHLGVYRS